jgi:hypothetical protein
MPGAFPQDRAQLPASEGLDQQALHLERERLGGGVYQWETLEDAQRFTADRGSTASSSAMACGRKSSSTRSLALTDNTRGTVERFEDEHEPA